MCSSEEIVEEKATMVSSSSNSLSRNNVDQDNKKEDIMGATKKHQSEAAAFHPPNMMAEASWWSRLVFYWPYPLLKLGLERPLVDSDIPEILKPDTSRYNREYLSDLWENEQERCRRINNANNNKNKNKKPQQKPSLHRAILVDFFRSIWYIQPIMCIAAVAKIVQAVYLGNLIESFEKGADNVDGYTFAGAIVLCGLIILFEHRK